MDKDLIILSCELNGIEKTAGKVSDIINECGNNYENALVDMARYQAAFISLSSALRLVNDKESLKVLHCVQKELNKSLKTK